MYRQRFGLTGHPFPQDARGKTFFETPEYKKLARRFQLLAAEPGIGVLTADSGVGKTAAIRNLCTGLPRPDHKVCYLCDTATSPLELYRQLARELGLAPCYRRGQLWHELKKTLVQMVDEHGIRPLVIIDEAQHLSERFLGDLSGFVNFQMDSRSLLTLWLVGQPQLRSVVRMKHHASLASRITTAVHLEPISDRKVFARFLTHVRIPTKSIRCSSGSRSLVPPDADRAFRGCRSTDTPSERSDAGPILMHSLFSHVNDFNPGPGGARSGAPRS